MDLEDLAIFLDRDSFIEDSVRQVKNDRYNQAGGNVQDEEKQIRGKEAGGAVRRAIWILLGHR